MPIFKQTFYLKKYYVMTYEYSMLYKTCTLQFVVKVEL